MSKCAGQAGLFFFWTETGSALRERDAYRINATLL